MGVFDEDSTCRSAGAGETINFFYRHRDLYRLKIPMHSLIARLISVEPALGRKCGDPKQNTV